MNSTRNSCTSSGYWLLSWIRIRADYWKRRFGTTSKSTANRCHHLNRAGRNWSFRPAHARVPVDPRRDRSRIDPPFLASRASFSYCSSLVSHGESFRASAIHAGRSRTKPIRRFPFVRQPYHYTIPIKPFAFLCPRLIQAHRVSFSTCPSLDAESAVRLSWHGHLPV